MARLRALIDKLQTEVSIGLFQAQTDFISEKLLPEFGAKQSSGIIGKYKGNYLRVHANAMGGEGEAPRVRLLDVDITNTFRVQNHGLVEYVTPEDQENYDTPFDAERDVTEMLAYALLVAKEVALASAMADTGTLTLNTQLSGTSQFSDPENSDPIGVFDTACEAVRAAGGFWPDTAWMELKVRNRLRRHPQLWERLGYKYNQTGQLTDADLADALNVKRVLSASGVYNSASEGQTDDIDPIWGNHAWVGVMPTGPGQKQKAGGYHVFRKAQGVRRVYKYAVNNPPDTTAILCQDNYDMVLTGATDSMYFIEDAVA